MPRCVNNNCIIYSNSANVDNEKQTVSFYRRLNHLCQRILFCDSHPIMKNNTERRKTYNINYLESEEINTEKLRFSFGNSLLFIYLHLVALKGLFLCVISAKVATIIFGLFVDRIARFGITAGVHRLWAHRSYKAKWPLRLILVFLNTMAFQKSIIDWARDHRVHHKFSDTNADPHNINRGFLFSQFGWLVCERHSECEIKSRKMDISDLLADPLLRLQHQYYKIIMPIIAFLLPTLVPMFLWNETFDNAFCVNVLQYIYSLHVTGLVNSAAHLWGYKPYDRSINPAENITVSILTNGEGFHNYHHTFPWDYKTSELGKYTFNWTTAFIDFFAKIGWAYDLKTVSDDMVRKRIERTGDRDLHVWGWGDKDQPKEEWNEALVLHRKHCEKSN